MVTERGTRCVRHIVSLALGLLVLAPLAAPAAAPRRAGEVPSVSVYERLPADPAAVVVRGVGDGVADDTAAIQSAIDAATTRGHVVFIPEGRYRLTRTVLLRSGVRVLGVGRRRPVLVLADNTPGFAQGVAAVVSFTGEDQFRAGRPAVPPPTTVPFDPAIFDGTQTTFYSALANVDFEIGAGNAGAVAVRFRVAQHAFLRHIDFHLGSAFAGVYQVGNEAEDLKFYGGRYGIVAEKTAPTWPFTLLDSTFVGQRDAAIREHEAGMTLVNVVIRNTPVGIDIDEGYGEYLWGKQVRFENVSRAGVIISMERSALTQVGFEDAIASNTPVFAHLRDSGTDIAAPGQQYRVRAFSHGYRVQSLGATGAPATSMDAAAVAALPPRSMPAIRALPAVTQWVNARTLGLRGDGATDETSALQRAIDQHRVLYLPTGRYNVSKPLRLRPDSVLIALHPDTTQIVLADHSPPFAGVGNTRGLVESARGGAPIMSGLGLWTGAINPRAAALIWRAGAESLVDDVRIHGPVVRAGNKVMGANEPGARPDGQQASIWVTDGGGGTFTAIWSPNTLASAGFLVTDTSTPGHVYELSAEHHHRHEIVLRNVRNWEFLGAQTEQEVRDGPYAVSMQIHDSSDILFANYRSYRVTRTARPMETAIQLFNTGSIRFRNVHVNAESGFATCDSKGCGTFERASKYPFENTIRDMTRGLDVRERDFAVLDVPAVQVDVPAPREAASLRRLATGFYGLGGGAADASGQLYFVDRFYRRLHRWSPEHGLEIVTDTLDDPVSVAVDASGDLLVLSSAGRDSTVYSLDPARPDQLRVVTPSSGQPQGRMLIPGNFWANGEFADRYDPATGRFPTLAQLLAAKLAEARPNSFKSPDGSLALPAFRVWNQGDERDGWRWSDPLQAYGLVSAAPGERVVFTNSSENRTYDGVIAAAGAISDLRVLADRGGESAVRDARGTLYVANGEVFVYAPDGTARGSIHVPDRPIQLVIGGPDRRTLFILTQRALYAMQI